MNTNLKTFLIAFVFFVGLAQVAAVANGSNDAPPPECVPCTPPARK